MALSSLTSHRDVQRSPVGTCTAGWHPLCDNALQSCSDTQGEVFQRLHGACQHAALRLQKQEQTHLLIGGN